VASAFLLLGATPVRAQLKVAAASDLSQAFKAVGEAFEKQGGKKVTFVFGSTGLLAKQIEQGAPFDVFAAANVSFAEEAVRSGACAEDSKALYARGRLVVWTRKGKAPHSLSELKDPRFVKIAIANPEHAPYGRAAMQAFTRAGVLDAVKSRLVYGENVQQALQFAQSGNAEAAVVALSLVATGTEGETLAIDPALHASIEQVIVICGKDPKKLRAGREFTGFVTSPQGRQIMSHFGFSTSGEVALGGK
jgi:molybdate transport system substrate-binding protein